MHDVFISYRSVNRAWVETLATNLKSCGFSVFLDRWSLVPGDALDRSLAHALDESRAAVLVATPEAAESRWVQDEYAAFRRRSDRNDGFRFVPVRFGSGADFPFLDGVIGIDFSDPSKPAYTEAFHRLVSGLRGVPPGPGTNSYPALEVPAPISSEPEQLAATRLGAGEERVVDEIFDRLRGVPVLVLAQEGADRTLIHKRLLERAKASASYGARVLHLVCPAHAGATVEEYFAELAKESGVEPRTRFAWLDELRRRTGAGPLFLLVSRLEHGSESGRNAFAAELRGLSEEHGGKLHIVMSGAERLAELKFAQGRLSLLNAAEVVAWPDPSVADLLARQRDRGGSDVPLDEASATSLLTLTGGHARLIDQALRLHTRGLSIEEIARELEEDATLTSSFTRWREPESARDNVRRWLREERLPGQRGPWPSDATARALYWANLLTWRKRELVWRSELVREIGRRVLEP